MHRRAGLFGRVGLTNGVVTTYFRVPSFITTLGMLFLLNGITLHLLAGTQVFMPGGGTFKSIFGSQPGSTSSTSTRSSTGRSGSCSLVQFVLSLDALGPAHGRHRREPDRRRRGGVNVRMVKIGNFVLANLLAGFAGILDSTRMTTIVPLQGGPDMMFLAVAGAVIGGTSLFGGSGHGDRRFIGVAVLYHPHRLQHHRRQRLHLRHHHRHRDHRCR